MSDGKQADAGPAPSGPPDPGRLAQALASIPGPPRRLDGNLLPLARDRLGFLRRIADEHGDVVRFQVGKATAVLLNHPDLVRDVLVTHADRFHKTRSLKEASRVLGDGLITSDGEAHDRPRRMMQPMFHRERIAAWGGQMVADAARHAGTLQDGAGIDMVHAMLDLSLTTVGGTLFGSDMESERATIERSLDDVLAMFDWAFLPNPDALLRLPLPRVRRFHAANRAFDGLVTRLVERRRAAAARGQERRDLLALLLEARDEGAAFTASQVRDHVLTVLLAGHETTGLALAWTWWLLAHHPAAEARLHQEVDEVLAGRPATAADLPRLDWTRRVLAESMRLYPPVWMLGRAAIAPYAAQGHELPVGTPVAVSQYLLHRDPRFWDQPHLFDPERFSPAATAARPRHAYFPFGSGPRMCIGEPYAWMAGTLAIATVAQQWRFRADPGPRIRLQPLITLRPKGGLPMQVEARRIQG